jgi:hypothetical protein
MIWIGVLIAVILTVIILLAYKFRRPGDRDIVIGPGIFIACVVAFMWGMLGGGGYSSTYLPDTITHQEYEAGTFAQFGGVKDDDGKYITVTQRKASDSVDATVQFVYKNGDGQYVIAKKSADHVIIKRGGVATVEHKTYKRESRVFVPWTSSYSDLWIVTVPDRVGAVDYVGSAK